ncbi:hypothetical protein D3C76_676240 [compost metagenome]
MRCIDTNNPVPKLNRIPASIAAAMAAGSLLMIRSKAPEMPTTKMIRLLTRYAPTASAMEMSGNSVTSNAEPGADQAMITGTR